jgi:ribosome biogenesis protein NSA2
MIPLLSVNSLAMHEESTARRKADDNVQEGAVPAYLLDRENTARAKVCHSRSIEIQY